MKRVLVLGGYGGFGGRISQGLAKAGAFQVVVAGRSARRAEAFCAAHPALTVEPAVMDRDGELEPTLRGLNPWLVVDAAGPFQGADHALAQACIDQGRHYLDIADDRAFVAGIAALDEAARRAGVVVLSGASSVPTLSSAVADALSAGLTRVSLIETAISAANRATSGPSVLRAILSYVGRPLLIPQAGRVKHAFGGQELARRSFSIVGTAPLHRTVALADAPDLALQSDRYPGRPRIVVRAGGALGFQNIGLWLLSWPVRWGWVRSLTPLQPVVALAKRLTDGWGGLRSAMLVRVVGEDGGGPIERRWTLLAEDGQGAWTPCLAAPLLTERISAGEVEPGARAAVGLIPLAAFERAFAAFPFRTAVQEVRPPPPLYARVMGIEWDHLSPAVAALHAVQGAALAEGRASVERGRHPIARLIAWTMRFPAARRDGSIAVWFSEDDGVETWTRDFGGERFASRLSQDGALLVERFGPLAFRFHLQRHAAGLSMRLRGWRLGPLPLPLSLAPRIAATETDAGGRFHLDVAIDLPLVGPIVRYRGWLERLA